MAFLFFYHYSTSAPTGHRANERRYRSHTQVPCCLFLHHIMCQLCLYCQTAGPLAQMNYEVSTRVLITSSIQSE